MGWGFYGRVEAMEWAEDDGVDYILGLAGNTTLDALVAETADNLPFQPKRPTPWGGQRRCSKRLVQCGNGWSSGPFGAAGPAATGIRRLTVGNDRCREPQRQRHERDRRHPFRHPVPRRVWPSQDRWRAPRVSGVSERIGGTQRPPRRPR
jgi:hypothetical protein